MYILCVVFQRNYLYDNLWLAVRYGHRKLAGQIIKEQEETAFSQFNALHRDVSLSVSRHAIQGAILLV